MLKSYLDKETQKKWELLIAVANHIVIIGHMGPDGDAMGSSLGLYHYLKGIGKNVQVIMPNLYPDFLGWLPGASDIVVAEYHYAVTKRILSNCDLIFYMDFNDIGRLEDFGKIVQVSDAPIIIIDHHLDPESQSSILISDASACSTAEVLFCILWQLGAYEKMSKECACCIYCGMMTDTGGFTYNSTRPEIYFIISQLLSKGIDKDKIYRKVFHNYSVERMRLMGYVLDKKMEYFPEYNASIFAITREEMIRYKFKKGDAEGLVNLPLEIKGMRLSISLREDTEKPLIRVSLRSVDNFPCNKMSQDFFNGGGHLNASGGLLKMTMPEAVKEAKRAIEFYKTLLEDNKEKLGGPTV